MVTRVGVLALQGDFAAHVAAFERAGGQPIPVRRPADLAAVPVLAIPGGESTTMLRMMEDAPWFAALRAFHARGGAIFGTCAGAILLAAEVRPQQPSLGLLDVTVARNAYGRQVDSFSVPIETALGRLDGVFIRAPRIERVGPSVEVLGRHAGAPVLMRQGRVLAATFHPELAHGSVVHRTVLAMASRAASSPAAVSS